MMVNTMKTWPFLFLIVITFPLACTCTLQVGFYRATCRQAETTIQKIIQRRFAADKSVVAALLRMHYHDCFIRGCDASILIDSTGSNQAEKDAGANLSVREYNLIDQIKARLETICPRTVSCADIIALAARDAVALAGGPKYHVPTGRRDGLVSRAEEVIMPGPTSTVSEAQQAFAANGLMLSDMVVLLGAHTIGVAHCSFFQDRVSHFQGSGAPDPNMNPTLAKKLKKLCSSNPNVDRTVFLDQNTSFVVDNQFYKQIVNKRGVLQIDQKLALDKSSSNLVTKLAVSNALFKQEFAKALVKLGKLQVLEGNKGEIRKNCRLIN